MLERTGYLVRTRDADDTRRQVPRITPEGRVVHDQIMDRFARAEHTPQEQATLMGLLDKMARDVESWRS